MMKLLTIAKESKYQRFLLSFLLFSLVALVIRVSLRLSFHKFDNFAFYKYDLGNFSQTLWNTTRGRFFEYTDEFGKAAHRFGTHFNPSLIIFAPLYKIWPDSRLLLVINIFVLASGAFPLYLIAHRILKNRLAAFLIAVAYLLNPLMGHLLVYDFHLVSLVTTFFLVLFWAYLEERWWIFWPLLFVILGSKEEIGLVVGFFGLWLSLFEKKKKLGVKVALLGFLWTLVAVLLVIPHFRAGEGSPHQAFAAAFGYLGKNYQSALRNIVSEPQRLLIPFRDSKRLNYVLTLLAAQAFLPLLALPVLLIALPELGLNFFSAIEHMHDFYYQYNGPILPFLFLAAVFAVRRASSQFPGARQNLAAVALSSVLVVSSGYFSEKLNSPIWPYFRAGGPLVKVRRLMERKRPLDYASIPSPVPSPAPSGEKSPPPPPAASPPPSSQASQRDSAAGNRWRPESNVEPKDKKDKNVIRKVPLVTHRRSDYLNFLLQKIKPGDSFSGPNFLGYQTSLRKVNAIFPARYLEADVVVAEVFSSSRPEIFKTYFGEDLFCKTKEYVRDLYQSEHHQIVLNGNGLLTFRSAEADEGLEKGSLDFAGPPAENLSSGDYSVGLKSLELGPKRRLRLEFNWNFQDFPGDFIPVTSFLGKENQKVAWQIIHLPLYVSDRGKSPLRGKYIERFEVELPPYLDNDYWMYTGLYKIEECYPKPVAAAKLVSELNL